MFIPPANHYRRSEKKYSIGPKLKNRGWTWQDPLCAAAAAHCYGRLLQVVVIITGA
jgi:hypothetical protein